MTECVDFRWISSVQKRPTTEQRPANIITFATVSVQPKSSINMTISSSLYLFQWHNHHILSIRFKFNRLNTMYRNTMLSRNRLKEVSFNVIRNPFLGYHIIIDTVSFDNDAVRIWPKNGGWDKQFYLTQFSSLIHKCEQFQNVKNSISSFISLLPTGLYVSVNSFDSQEVTEVQKFTRINGTNSRDEVLKSIRDNISCNTGEGSYGFIKALNRAQLVSKNLDSYQDDIQADHRS